MLNHFNQCPICNNSKAFIPVKEYDKEMYACEILCNNKNNCYILKNHCIVYYESDRRFEQIIIGDRVLIFRENELFIAIMEESFCKENVCIKDTSILFQDLDSVEKIKTFIENYNILC